MHSEGLLRLRRAGQGKGNWAAGLCVFFLGFTVSAADIASARREFLSGEYEKCIQMGEAEVRDRFANTEWRLLLAEAYLAVGRYANANTVITAAIERAPWSVRAHLLAREILLYNGQTERAQSMLDAISRLVVVRGRWSSPEPADLVALGQAALLAGADPRRVLDTVYDRAKAADPDLRDVHLAMGRLALDKNDYALAAKTFAEALQRFPKDPDFHFGLAQAYKPSDRGAMIQELEAALRLNPRHVESHLLIIDHLLDGEDYATAQTTLEKVLAVNPWEPRAWAYRAVIRHFAGDTPAEIEAREQALKFWSNNPAVDHLIGRKLSQRYRFAEGADRQRQALRFDPKYVPAKIQLAQDLLRLGDEVNGWKLAEEAFQEDGYDVTTYNLTALRETLSKFQTLTNQDFIVRMIPQEAAVYGPQVLQLLQRAKEKLCAKYELTLDQPTVVEIFPDPKDFGVRTFGMPENPGYLGVCFGPVITANSPASQAAHPANWQAVLWHEFCHVITLRLTRNKMPRWLSEGISVYEERLEHPAWGQDMNPRYREMILGHEFVPPGKLSAAFLTPKSDLHLQFAYYESSLVVEFLVERFGLAALKRVLADLAKDHPVNETLARHTAPMDQFERDFASFARKRARQLAPGLDWEKYPVEQLEKAETSWLARRTNNFYVLTQLAERSLREKQWQAAKPPLELLIRLYPNQTGAGNAYFLLAEAHRALNETGPERQVLEQLASQDPDAISAYMRLMELAANAGDWPALATNAERCLAVNPLTPQPHRYLAQAAEKLGRTDTAIVACRALLELDPPDPAAVHFQLARLLHQKRDPAARRHVLKALEEAPRYREALQLLLELNREKSTRLEPVSQPAGTAQPSRSEPVQNAFGWCWLLGPWFGQRRGRRPGKLDRKRSFVRGRKNRFQASFAIPSFVIFALVSFFLPSPPLPAQSLQDRGGVPKWELDKEFAKDVFTFVRIRYTSTGYRSWGGAGMWDTDYPDAELNLAYRLQQMTSLRVDPEGKVLELTDQALFDYPFIYIVEPGELEFHEDEVKALRRYLLNGGFLMVDDFWGERQWRSFYRQLKRVFPEREAVELPLEHPIFHCVFDLKEKPQVPNVGRGTASQYDHITWETWDSKEPHYKGIFDDQGRLMVMICHNTDLGDGWEREGENEYYFREFSEKKAYPLGINIIFYAMTH